MNKRSFGWDGFPCGYNWPGSPSPFFKKILGKFCFCLSLNSCFVEIQSYLYQYLNSKALNYHKRWENDGSLSPLQSIELCSQQQPASAGQPTARIAKHMARVGMVWCNPPPGEHQRAGELLQGYASSSNFQITIQRMEIKGVNCRIKSIKSTTSFVSSSNWIYNWQDIEEMYN